MTFDGYAARRIDIVARDRARFGAGIVAELPSILSDVGGGAAFVVTDPGVVRSGVAGRVVDLLRTAGVDVQLHDEIEPNPGTALIERGSNALRRFAADRRDVVLVALGGGSTMDSGKVIALHATNDRDVLSLGYHDESHMIHDVRRLADATPEAMLAARARPRVRLDDRQTTP